MAVSKNPYLFVVGCPRSGTTLLQRMLDNHPSIAVANDSHFIVRAIKKVLKKDHNPEMRPEFVQQVLSYRRFHRMGLSDAQVYEAAAGCGDYRTFVARLYDQRGLQQGKPLSGEKTPDYCRYVVPLHTLFPNARFVHIVRDGRNTALSTLKWASPGKGPGRWDLWRIDPLACCALWWRWQTLQGLRDGRVLSSSSYHELRYEDLVDDPNKALAAIALYLEVENSLDMVYFYKGKTRSNPKLSPKSAWKPATKGLRDWRDQMSRDDQALFHALTGDLLEHLGYSRGHAEQSSEVEQRVNKAQNWWASTRQSKAIRDIGSSFLATTQSNH